MMFRRFLVRGMMCVGLLVVSILASACQTTAREQALAGDSQHERHATGLDSQSRDY